MSAPATAAPKSSTTSTSSSPRARRSLCSGPTVLARRRYSTPSLGSDAPVILADELSVGLAPVIVDEIFAAVDRLRAEGRSLLIVEQYVDRALAVADYVYILH